MTLFLICTPPIQQQAKRCLANLQDQENRKRICQLMAPADHLWLEQELDRRYAQFQKQQESIKQAFDERCEAEAAAFCEHGFMHRSKPFTFAISDLLHPKDFIDDQAPEPVSGEYKRTQPKRTVLSVSSTSQIQSFLPPIESKAPQSITRSIPHFHTAPFNENKSNPKRTTDTPASRAVSLSTPAFSWK